MRSSLYLIDSSAWLEVLPAGRNNMVIANRTDTLLAADRVATTGMIKLELLGGTRTETEWNRLRSMLDALHDLTIQDEEWLEAARMGFQLRRQGITVPFTDLVIAAAAKTNEATIIHRDHHFDLIAARITLSVESYVNT